MYSYHFFIAYTASVSTFCFREDTSSKAGVGRNYNFCDNSKFIHKPVLVYTCNEKACLPHSNLSLQFDMCCPPIKIAAV